MSCGSSWQRGAPLVRERWSGRGGSIAHNNRGTVLPPGYAQRRTNSYMPRRIAVVIACSALIAACGSSSPSTKNAAKGYSQALAFSKCMRAHGVSSFPDASTSGGGVQLSIGPSSGVNPQAPAFEAAQQSGKHLMPGGGQPSAQASAQAKARLLRTSECMRAHGITGFPDPQTGSPPSNPTGYSAVMGVNGAFIAIPSSINPGSPAFKQAAAACNFGPRGAQSGKGG
jgi:hypothetical protein